MQLYILTFFCMTLFASNSLICRAALITYGMEPFSYTALRSLSAAAMLLLLCLIGVIKKKEQDGSALRQAWKKSSWKASLFLFLYIICFSFSYVNMPSAAGTLVLNVAVQIAMLGWGMWLGVRPKRLQCAGLTVALIGLVILVFPGLSSPPLWNSFLMLCCGLSWGAFSLCGRNSDSAALSIAGNFLRCVPAGIISVLFAFLLEGSPNYYAVICAICAGAIPSALGYILWYAIVPRYNLVSASVIQLSIPVITAVLAVPILSEAVTLRLVFCSVLILGGITIAMLSKK